MSPPHESPTYPTDAYEDFWAAVDAELAADLPAVVVPHGPAPATDAYAAFTDAAEG
jgi:hypothetical protein